MLQHAGVLASLVVVSMMIEAHAWLTIIALRSHGSHDSITSTAARKADFLL